MSGKSNTHQFKPINPGKLQKEKNKATPPCGKTRGKTRRFEGIHKQASGNGKNSPGVLELLKRVNGKYSNSEILDYLKWRLQEAERLEKALVEQRDALLEEVMMEEANMEESCSE